MTYSDTKSDGGMDPRDRGSYICPGLNLTAPSLRPIGEAAAREQAEQRRAELARADRLLSPDELREKYSDEMHGGEHPQYSKHDWCMEVAEHITLRGYWDWVAAQIEEED